MYFINMLGTNDGHQGSTHMQRPHMADMGIPLDGGFQAIELKA